MSTEIKDVCDVGDYTLIEGDVTFGDIGYDAVHYIARARRLVARGVTVKGAGDE